MVAVVVSFVIKIFTFPQYTLLELTCCKVVCLIPLMYNYFFATSVQTAILRCDIICMFPFFHSESFGEEAHNTRKESSVCFKRKGSTKQTQPSILC